MLETQAGLDKLLQMDSISARLSSRNPTQDGISFLYYRRNESIQAAVLLNISCSNLRRHNNDPGSGFVHFLHTNVTEIGPSLYGIIYGLDDP